MDCIQTWITEFSSLVVFDLGFYWTYFHFKFPSSFSWYVFVVFITTIKLSVLLNSERFFLLLNAIFSSFDRRFFHFFLERNETKKKERNETKPKGTGESISSGFHWPRRLDGKQTVKGNAVHTRKKQKRNLDCSRLKANRRFSSSPLALHFILLTWFCLPCFRHLGPVKNDDHVVVLIGPGKNRMRKKATLFFSNAITSKLIRVEWRPLQLGRRWDWINRLAIPGNELDGNRLKRIGNGNRTERQHWVSIQRSCAERKKNSESNSKWNHKKLG